MQKNNYFTQTTAQQRTILEQAAIKKALPKQGSDVRLLMQVARSDCSLIAGILLKR